MDADRPSQSRVEFRPSRKRVGVRLVGPEGRSRIPECAFRIASRLSRLKAKVPDAAPTTLAPRSGESGIARLVFYRTTKLNGQDLSTRSGRLKR
jgi:hypothetical protein